MTPSSGISPSLPNAGIAQGAMFVVKGSRLGPSSIVIANSFPLQKVLAGTSVQIVSGGQTVDAIMYYTQAQQVAAILPSNTPVGQGYVSITYNGMTNSAPIVVVQNNVGMYTIDQAGGGDAVATLADYSLVLPNNAPNPGEVVVLWANGLGPVQSDETKPPPTVDMTSVPLSVFIGGKPANVLYHGRNSCCVSLDQINVQIPQGVTGCAVSIGMQIGTLVSNLPTIPIASSGRVCTPTLAAISQADVRRILAMPTFNVGSISLSRSVAGSPLANPIVRDSVGAAFVSIPAPSSLLLDNLVDIPSYGSCIMPGSALAGLYEQYLDAGNISGSGSNGSFALAKQTLSNGVAYTTGSLAPFLDPGSYTVTGTGGPDVGALTLHLTVPPAFAWTNYDQITAIERNHGVTVTWTGGDPAGYVIISGTSAADSSPHTFNASASFACYARASDGSFTVPPFVLLALPPTGTTLGVQGGSLTVSGTAAPLQFQASGIGLGLGISSVSSGLPVIYR